MKPALIIAGLILAAAIAKCANAHDPKHPEWDAWFIRQHNMANGSCCQKTDARYVKDGDWGTAHGHYWVVVEGVRYALDDYQVVKMKPNDPNPTGRAIVWWDYVRGEFDGNGYLMIYCFVPATMS